MRCVAFPVGCTCVVPSRAFAFLPASDPWIGAISVVRCATLTVPWFVTWRRMVGCGGRAVSAPPVVQREERSSFGSMLSTAGLLDAFRWRHPAASGAFSYYSQRFPANRAKNKGLRLDYVLADHAICADDTGPTNGNGGVAAVAASATASGSGGSGVRLVDSYILDGIGFIADHVAVGCDLVLPGLKK